MIRTWHAVRRFLAEEQGPAAIEYAFLAAMIIAVCVTAINTVGTATSTSLRNSATAIQNAGS